MATEQTVKGLKAQLERIKKLEKEQLISRPKWGELNFEESRRQINRTYGLTDQLGLLPVELLPDQTLQKMTQTAERVAQTLEKVDKFSIQTSGNVASERQTLINEVTSTGDEYFLVTAQWLPYLAYQRGDVDRNIQNLTKSVQDAEGLVGQAKENIKGREREMDDIITKAREASAAAGAAVFTKDFEESATKMDGDARTWLRITTWAAIITLLSAGAFWLWPQAGLDSSQVIQRLSTKLVLLAVLVSATVWCGRNYKALKHLATVSRHRALSIRTLQAFSAAASDPQTKDAVFLEATRAVFGNVPTGYIEGGSSDGDLKVIEVARGILPKSEK